MRRHVVVALLALAALVVSATSAWAAMSNAVAGGPEQIVSASLSPAPVVSSVANTGCAGTNLRTNVTATWTDSQSAALDATGDYLVSGYSIARAATSGGTYTSAGTVSGAPPALTFADTPTVANTPVALIADATATGSKLVYPLSESSLSIGTGITIGTASNEVNAIQITPDGLTAVIAEYTSGQVQILTWSGSVWSLVKTITVTLPTAVAINSVPNAGGNYIAYVVSDPGATSNGAVTPITLNGASSAAGTSMTIQRQANPTAVVVTPNGGWLYVTNYNSSSVSAINLISATVTNLKLPGTTANPVALATTPDSSHVYVADRLNNVVHDINTSTTTVAATITLAASALNDTTLTGTGNPNLLAMSPTGTALYVAEFGASAVQKINTALSGSPNTIAATISTGAGSKPINLAITPNGCTLYVPDWPSDKIFAIATATNTVTTAFTATCQTQDPQALQVTPDNQYLIVPENYSCGDVQILNTTTNAVTTLGGVGSVPAMVAVPPVSIWYEVTATHSLWTSNPSSPLRYPAGWNPGAWQ